MRAPHASFRLITIAVAAIGFASFNAQAAESAFPTASGASSSSSNVIQAQPAQSAAPSVNNEVFNAARTKCETAVPSGKASGDICVEAAALLLGTDLPDAYREMSEELRIKFALRLLERAVDGSNIARGRAYAARRDGTQQRLVELGPSATVKVLDAVVLEDLLNDVLDRELRQVVELARVGDAVAGFRHRQGALNDGEVGFRHGVRFDEHCAVGGNVREDVPREDVTLLLALLADVVDVSKLAELDEGLHVGAQYVGELAAVEIATEAVYSPNLTCHVARLLVARPATMASPLAFVDNRSDLAPSRGHLCNG